MFAYFDDAARQCIVLTQEEARRLGHAEIGAEHLLLGIARVAEPLVGADVERLRAAVVALDGVGDATAPEMLQFSPEARAALDGANQQALSRGHTTIDPAHLLLSVLDADGVARRVLRETDLIVADAAAGRRKPGVAASATGADHAQDLRDGLPVSVTLGQEAFPIGDLGHPRVDGELLRLLLVKDTPAARLLRAQGVDEAAVDAALGPDAPA